MENPDDLDGFGIWTIDDQVGMHRPEPQRLGSEIGTQMAELRTLRQHAACSLNLREDLPGGSPIPFRNEVPNLN